MKNLATLLGLLLTLAFQSCLLADEPARQPNILWLVQEDLSPWLGCYSYELQKGHTPTIDGMAAKGVRFSRAFVPSPVCSTCRSAIITGANQIRFGAHEHRSRRGKASLPLPKGMKTIPELMTDAGYFCFNVGKTDYNFEHSKLFPKVPKQLKDTPWRATPKGRPFFGQIQLKGGKLNTKKFQNKTDRSKVTIPADYPQNEMYREIVAEHFDSARMDDGIIAGILKRLKADGLTESTIVVYFSDHGANNLVRHKQQPTEGGSHVPFIVSGPAPWVPTPAVRNDLVSMLDLSATTLAWGGVEQPEWMEGQDLFGKHVIPREFVATARDRCDQTIDRIRSIRTNRYRYIRNYMLDRVLLQPQYRDSKDYVKFLRDSYADGSLDPKLAKIFFGERPAEELYDVAQDPAHLNNLIDIPKYSEQADRHRELLADWLAKGDAGEGDEPKIELEMASNKKWGQGVNPEFESIRKDSDGDGLSDEWEKINGRAADDGQLLFTFDCGGWQDEGWRAEGNLTNISGRQGFLDFDLIDGSGAIERQGLNLDPNRNPGSLQLNTRCSAPTIVKVFANNIQLAETVLNASKQFQTIESANLVSMIDDKVKNLRIEFKTTPGATVEIDWIKISSSPESQSP